MGPDEPPADPYALVRPAYGEASLADLIPAVLAALGVPRAPDPLRLTDALAGVRRVAVLLVDGLGHQLLPQAAPVAAVLAEVVSGRLGSLQPLTSSFPSTTPTALASLGTGAVPGAHGIVGFTVAVPGSDRLLTHIDWGDDPDPLHWQPLPTQFMIAAAAGVTVSVVSRSSFIGSGLTRAVWRGGRYLPADDPSALADGMRAALRDSPAPALVYGYHPDVDAKGHRHGVDSAAWRAAVAELNTLLTRLIDGLPPDAALIVTADHGMVDVPPGHRRDTAADPRLRGGLRAIAGEPRVRYLYPRPGAADDVLATWREVLGDTAWVAGRDELVAGGWFGAVSDAHLPRLGEVVAVCRDRYGLLASGSEPASVAGLVGMHGSWTAREMLVPLALIRGDRERSVPGVSVT